LVGPEGYQKRRGPPTVAILSTAKVSTEFVVGS
jgi:hypothetical protein